MWLENSFGRTANVHHESRLHLPGARERAAMTDLRKNPAAPLTRKKPTRPRFLAFLYVGP
jgi:hypothetical protein